MSSQFGRALLTVTSQLAAQDAPDSGLDSEIPPAAPQPVTLCPWPGTAMDLSICAVDLSPYGPCLGLGTGQKPAEKKQKPFGKEWVEAHQLSPEGPVAPKSAGSSPSAW